MLVQIGESRAKNLSSICLCRWFSFIYKFLQSWEQVISNCEKKQFFSCVTWSTNGNDVQKPKTRIEKRQSNLNKTSTVDVICLALFVSFGLLQFFFLLACLHLIQGYFWRVNPNTRMEINYLLKYLFYTNDTCIIASASAHLTVIFA